VTGLCKHVTALAHFVNFERCEGSTDTQQKWDKPSEYRQTLYRKGKTVEQLFHLNPVAEPSFQPDETKLSQFVELLRSENATNGMFFKSLTADRTNVTVSKSLPNVVFPKELLENLFQSKLPIKNAKVSDDVNLKKVFKNISLTLSPDLSKFFNENIVLTEDNCQAAFLTTVGQFRNPKWFSCRKNRISASKAHQILHARKKETRLKYFFGTTFTSKAMIYGQETESKAKETFESQTNCQVLPSGLVIKPFQSWLCASPDGLLPNEKACLEIKCPSSCQESEISVPYIKDGNLVKSHPYYTQVQIQMYVTNFQECQFFVFSDRDSKILTIKRDEEFL